MSNRVIALGSGLLVALGVGLGYLIIRTAPTADAVERGKQTLPPLPAINLQLLSNGSLTDRTSNGTLPIPIDGVGRTDPFAGA